MNERISLTMIVRNESVYLADCLESVKSEVDEIVIVDTGSTDDTISIARRYTPNVYSFPWNNDFSAARNFAIEHASGDWILALDADEEIQFQGPKSLHALLDREKDKEAFLLPLLNPVSDSTGEYNTFYVLRLFRNNGGYQYVGMIHEQVSLPDQQKVGLAKGPILKHKSLPLKIRHQKRIRNLNLLKKASQEDPHNPFLHYYLGVEWLMLGKPAYALPFLQKAYFSLSDENLLFRAPALKYLILSFRALGRLDEALSLCLEASLDYPSFTDIFYLGGLLFEEKEEYPIALKWLDHAITCGNPPALFNHLTGSESFLAYYHLGFCYEQIGKIPEAREAYETALKLNPSYPYPLYSLFLILLREKGSSLSYQHLEDSGFLNDPLLCLTSADLFFLVENVEQAYLCLEKRKNLFLKDERFPFYYSKYCIYSGRVHEGFNRLHQMTVDHSFYKDGQKLSIVALILLGDFQSARSLAISFWKHPSTRCEAHIFLYILRFMQNNKLPTPSLKVQETDILNPTLELLADCKRYRSHESYHNPLVATYSLGLESLIKFTEKGFHQLIDDYDQRLLDLKNLLVAKFGNCGISK
ncbi:glycosyltransferase family 2 protein [Desulfosporosinus sp. BICA1-9]|uniref:glycosyltransferase n=1 Tax=Desulfosporosinus sp. BICA1-9 TaxID=1531958 RepID=UPI00054C7002|nr:glycosyltransferase family 2 protein [Desulfosporosinus sp. BICA1-9]KJS47429.1 MAG: glycosyl transferase family 2 [Peptococcaceae bacterium BRH_c23]KJS90322.1 MAG: glycosyl transferase family 2 [Desulfosporosinus sp. BICA1-9]HBW38560.1 tetratricopeptide repeat protein [Desulfosporosinus sp.]